MSTLYAFDATEFEIEFNAKPTAAAPVLVTHKLRKPTLDELADRERQSAYEMNEVSSREDEIRVDDEAANCRLWDKLVLAVKGYAGMPDWRTLTDDEKAKMRPGHKATAIKGMYLSASEIEDAGDGIAFADQTWTVKQTIAGIYEIRHTLREPTESERLRFNRTASSTNSVRGAKKSQVRIVTNLRAYAELFDALWQGCTGATVGDAAYDGSNRDAFLAAIDPIWKRQIVACLMSATNAALQD